MFCNKKSSKNDGKVFLFMLSFSFSVLSQYLASFFGGLLFRELLRHFLYAIVTLNSIENEKHILTIVKIAMVRAHKNIFFNNFIVESPREHSLSHTFLFFFLKKEAPKTINSQLKTNNEENEANNARDAIKTRRRES